MQEASAEEEEPSAADAGMLSQALLWYVGRIAAAAQVPPLQESGFRN